MKQSYITIACVVLIILAVVWYIDRRSTEKQIIGMVEQGISRSSANAPPRMDYQEYINKGYNIAAMEIATRLIEQGVSDVVVVKATKISFLDLETLKHKVKVKKQKEDELILQQLEERKKVEQAIEQELENNLAKDKAADEQSKQELPQ